MNSRNRCISVKMPTFDYSRVSFPTHMGDPPSGKLTSKATLGAGTGFEITRDTATRLAPASMGNYSSDPGITGIPVPVSVTGSRVPIGTKTPLGEKVFDDPLREIYAITPPPGSKVSRFYVTVEYSGTGGTPALFGYNRDILPKWTREPDGSEGFIMSLHGAPHMHGSVPSRSTGMFTAATYTGGTRGATTAGLMASGTGLKRMGGTSYDTTGMVADTTGGLSYNPGAYRTVSYTGAGAATGAPQVVYERSTPFTGADGKTRIIKGSGLVDPSGVGRYTTGMSGTSGGIGTGGFAAPIYRPTMVATGGTGTTTGGMFTGMGGYTGMTTARATGGTAGDTGARLFTTAASGIPGTTGHTRLGSGTALYTQSYEPTSGFMFSGGGGRPTAGTTGGGPTMVRPASTTMFSSQTGAGAGGTLMFTGAGGGATGMPKIGGMTGPYTMGGGTAFTLSGGAGGVGEMYSSGMVPVRASARDSDDGKKVSKRHHSSSKKKKKRTKHSSTRRGTKYDESD